MTNSRWPMTRDRGSACRLRPPDRTMPLRFLGPTLARTAGLDISYWALGIHWLLVIGHLPLVMHEYLVYGPAVRVPERVLGGLKACRPGSRRRPGSSCPSSRPG